MTDNQHWLTEYIQTGSDVAFRELVNHYLDLVYSTALRLVGGDAHRAEDVAQIVFVNLARNARTLPKDVKLGGWLHRDTCFAASTLMRGERRRQARERQAAELNALQNTTETDYSLVAPLLDEAINELGEDDRIAILLRFFEQSNFRSVGNALGSNEDAARMRVTRALEKLETYLKHRGITTTAASLGAVLTANAVHAAPVGLALTISTAAALTGTTIAAAATITTSKAIAMTALQKTLVTATVAVLAGAGIYEARQASELRSQVQTLQQQQAPIAEQIQQLQSERADATNRFASLADENSRLKQNFAEVLKLRGEVAVLRRTVAETAQVQSAIPEKVVPSSQDNLLTFAKEEMRTQATNTILRTVQKLKAELGLTPEQAEALQNIHFKYVETHAQQEFGEFAGKLSAEELETFRQSFAMEKAEAAAILTPGQLATYQQNSKDQQTKQAMTTAMAAVAELKEKFALTSEQQTALIPVLTQFGPIDAFATDAQNQFDARLRAMESILTPEQLQAYQQQKQKELEQILKMKQMLLGK